MCEMARVEKNTENEQLYNKCKEAYVAFMKRFEITSKCDFHNLFHSDKANAIIDELLEFEGCMSQYRIQGTNSSLHEALSIISTLSEINL